MALYTQISIFATIWRDGRSYSCLEGKNFLVPLDIIYIALLTMLASIIGTLAGFGISTIMVLILLTIFPLSQTLLLAGIIHWFNDVWKNDFIQRRNKIEAFF